MERSASLFLHCSNVRGVCEAVGSAGDQWLIERDVDNLIA